MGCCCSHPTEYDDDAPANAPTGEQSTTHLAAPPNPTSSSARHLTRSSTSETRSSSHNRHHYSRPLSEHYNRPLHPHVPGSSSRRRSRRHPRQWTRSQLNRERDAFFETRVTGRPEIWAALKAALELVDTELETAQGILDAAGVTLPTGDMIDGCYDQQGALYKIPSWMVCDPENLAEDDTEDADEDEGKTEEDEEEELMKEVKGKGPVLSNGEIIKVRARLSDRGGSDVVVEMGENDKVSVLTRRIMAQAGLHPPTRIRIAYLGKILKDHDSLPSQGWHSSHVINALVFPPPSTSPPPSEIIIGSQESLYSGPGGPGGSRQGSGVSGGRGVRGR
ncbi:MAG: hypothetical protein M1834_001977 [Cirrosporium novae-zelandiae]|nr:MAG: hypothetical protein M1834_001977 [Cirrosporium novae-zelandiae]